MFEFLKFEIMNSQCGVGLFAKKVSFNFLQKFKLHVEFEIVQKVIY